MIKNSELENIEDDHQDLLENNLQDMRILNSLYPSEIQSTETKSSKTLETPIDLELNSMSSHTPDVYSSSSLTLSIIISADLPPDKEENVLEILQKPMISSGFPMSITRHIIRSMQEIFLVVDAIIYHEERVKLDLFIKYVVPMKIIKWPLEDVMLKHYWGCQVARDKTSVDLVEP